MEIKRIILPALLICLTSLELWAQSAPDTAYIDTSDFEKYLNLEFSNQQRDSMQDNLQSYKEAVKELHAFKLENSVAPSIVQSPFPQSYTIPEGEGIFSLQLDQTIELPKEDWQIAFLNISELSVLIKTQKLTSRRLTEIYLNRLKKFSDTLQCTISLLEEEALIYADQMDREIQSGNYRGPLHGIPYGVKDLFALEGTKTTWGAMPYKEQEINNTSTVITKLKEAGAVLVAKLTLGALAMGDVWYGGVTKNPWNLEQGSSGSSAGSGAATSAGLVAFAIGTETLGSIVSPSTRNGVTGLRPTYGRVSRAGGMALSWTMDKAGPMCRSALDCAIVLNEIKGADGIDMAAIDAPFNFDQTKPIKDLKVAYLKNLFERDYSNKSNDSITLAVFEEMGVKMEEVSLPNDIPYGSLRIILASEAAAAFDELTRSGKDELLVRQDKYAWPNYFRSARFISAVDYVNANRVRSILIEQINELFKKYDAIVTPTYGGPQLLATNLTGHPAICLPNGFNDEGGPTSFTILGNLFDEGNIVLLGEAYQSATDWDNKMPELFMKN